MRKSIFIFSLFVSLVFTSTVLAQTTEKKASDLNYKTTLSVTNNGISLIPTFSLGEPAAIWEMSIGNRLTFDPQFKFSLEGKPWVVVLWWRYKLIDSGKFRLGMGAHPGLLFSEIEADVDDQPKDIIQTKRFLVGELVPRYLINDKISVGMYYLYSRGLQEGLKNSHFLTVNANFSSIPLAGKTNLSISPQFYYLKMDENDGFYFTSSFTVSRKDCPVSVSSVINKTINSNIGGSKDFIWNVTLNYTISKKYSN